MTRAGKSPGVVCGTTTGAKEIQEDQIQYISSEPPLQALHLDGGARPCGSHAHEDSRANHADKPKNQCTSAKSSRKRSRYHPGSEFRPSEESLTKRERQVLDLLKERGPRGVTKLDAPFYLSLSLSSRVCDLRSKGYRIDTLRERVGDACIARYVLVATAPVPEARAVP